MSFRKRIEVVITDEAFARFIEEKGERTGLGMGPYLQALARAVYLVEQFDDLTLTSLLGWTHRPPVPAAAPPPAPPGDAGTSQGDDPDPALLDSLLDQVL